MSDNYVVVGLGTFGYTLALEIEKLGGEVLAIDSDRDVVQRISAFVKRAVCADARDLETLEELDVSRARAVVLAMPDHFDVSVIVTHYLARQKTERIFVQVASDAEGEAITVIGATTVIFPEENMAMRIAGEVLVPGASDHIYLDKRLAILKVKCPPDWVGKNLEKLELRRRYKVTVVSVIRSDESEEETERDPIPDPKHVFEEGDTVLLLGATHRLATLQELVGKPRT